MLVVRKNTLYDNIKEEMFLARPVAALRRKDSVQRETSWRKLG